MRLIVGMGIGQVSHCQAQPVGLKQGASDGWHHWATPTFANGQAEGLCRVWMELIKSFCHHERRHCHALCPHFTMGRIFPTETAPSPGAGGCRTGPHLTQYGIGLAKANRRALQNGISIQSSCLSTAHECDRHTRRTDWHSCSSLELELELEAVGLRSISFLVPNFVEFSSCDLKVLIVSVSMTSCDKWFQFCSTRWLKKNYVGLVTA